MSGSLSPLCRTYVSAVMAAGTLPLGWAMWTVVTDPPHAGWVLLATLALLNGRLCIRIPSLQATISVSEGFIFTCALLFGPAAATLVAAFDGVGIAIWSRKRSAARTLFGIAEPALSVCAASLLFYALADVPPLLHRSAELGPLILPLLALTLTYFGLNTLLAGTAVWLDTGGAPLPLLRQHLRHVVADAGVSLALAGAVVQASENVTLAAMVVMVPMLLASYISSHHVAGRLEDTSRHLAELRKLYDSTVETLAMAIDAKDQVTHGHIRRVQLLCRRVAEAIGADRRDVQALDAAALLHDLGKIAVPEHILNKPGPLTSAEYEEMKKHAHVGASILSAIDFPFPVVPIVRHHHENWDGSGYPDGLSGTAIPLGARILAVVDCYDALTSDRPYRRRMSHGDALEIIHSRSGRMYDPDVVEAFSRVHRAPDADAEAGESSGALLRPRLAFALKPQARAERHTGPGPRISPAAAGAGPERYRCARSAQFLGTVRGVGWHAAGRAVAAFVPTAIPDSVAALFRFDQAGHRLALAGVHRGFDARIPETITVGQGVTGWVAANRQAVANADAELDLGDVARITRPPLRLCISEPVVAGGRLAGVLTVYSPYAFSETDRMLVEGIAAELPAALVADSEGAPDVERAEPEPVQTH